MIFVSIAHSAELKTRVRHFLPLFFVYPLCLLVLMIVAYPVVWMILSSLKETWEVMAYPFSLPLHPTMDNYVEAWQTAKMGRAFLNSILMSSISLCGILLISTMAGYTFAKLDFPGKTFLFYFWLAGMMVPPHVSLIPNFLILDRLHLINTYLSLFLIYFSSTSFGVFVMRSFYFTVPTEILEAARIDGCSEFSTFWRIAVPLARGGLAVIAIFYFIFLWNDFIYPLTFLRNPKLNTIPLGLMAFVDIWADEWGPMLAALCMASLPAIILYFFFQKQFIRGLTAGALKG
ncbi:MAG: carbohydrate ABC transporter permease [Spirochaetota bacterium]